MSGDHRPEPGTDLILERDGPITWVRVNRPEVRNALSFDYTGRLIAALRELGEARDVRVIVLTGAGERAFISGADITEFRERLTTAAGALEYDERLEELARTLETMPKPVVAMVQGSAVGSGLLVALACDMRIAVEGAKFGIPVSKLGLVPSMPDVRRLVRFAGLSEAKRLLMTGEVIDSAQALAMGLLDQVVPRDAVRDVVIDVARTIASRAPLSIAAVKDMLATEATGGAGVHDRQDLYQSIYASRDFEEGVAAFFAKRAPVFQGH